jgi:hypothetical protein
MRRTYILLALLPIFQMANAQISFDPGEGCLNVVGIAAGKGLDQYLISVQYLHERFLNEQFCVGGGIGYSHLSRNDISAIPLFFSTHYFFLDQEFSPFVNLCAGAYCPIGAKSKQSGVSLYVAPAAGIKMHLAPHIGIMASANYDSYLIKDLDSRQMASVLSISIGLCFQIPGW